MDNEANIAKLHKSLKHEVNSLYQRGDLQWSRPIVEMLHDLRKLDISAVFFGGTLRSLLLSRLQDGHFGRPRDIDIVVSGVSLDALRAQFGELITRETRFGGLQLRRMDWQFDMWPLKNTWAFRKNGKHNVDFSDLPYTTFFNLEAIAVDVWVPPGKSRNVYAGDNQFFNGITDKVLEINQADNPFPALCVIRALLLAYSTGFSIGPRLAHYLIQHAPAIDDNTLLETQCKHYGKIRCSADLMRRWIDFIVENHDKDKETPLMVPRPKQLTFWTKPNKPSSIKFHVISE